jgi:DNA invertase Pin-like site-specific DNA recombinase
MNRVIIYARVSTKEQNIDMQIIDLRAYAQARGAPIGVLSGNPSGRTLSPTKITNESIKPFN